MTKKKINIYLFQGICAMILILLVLGGYLLSTSLRVAESKKEDNYVYVSYEVLSDNTTPVMKEQEKETIIKPYLDDDIKIVKNFYDYQEKSENQENSIIYYKDTYLQNNGVDYAKKEVFDVVSILPGKVLMITENDIVGKTIKIKHDNNIISVYQSLNNINVKIDEEIKQGQVIATSGVNDINKDLGNHLHFELYYNNKPVNPEKYYDKVLGEL